MKPSLSEIYQNQNTLNMVRGAETLSDDFILKAASYDYPHEEVVGGIVNHFNQMPESAKDMIHRMFEKLSTNIDLAMSYAEYRRLVNSAPH